MTERPRLVNVLMEDALEITNAWDNLEEARRDYDAVLIEQKTVDPNDQKNAGPMAVKVLAAKKHREDNERTLRTAMNNAKKNYADWEAKDKDKQKKAALDPLSSKTVTQGSLPSSSGTPVGTNPNVMLQPRDMKIKEPREFKGEQSDYPRWIFEIKNAINVKSSLDTDMKRITYVGTLMSDIALTWYQVWINKNVVNNVIIVTYAGFLQDLDTTFKDPNEVSNYRKMVMNARQKDMDFNAYAVHFMNLCQKAEYDLDTQLEVFKHGLNRQTLLAWHPTGGIPTTYNETIVSMRAGLEVYKNIQSLLPPRQTPQPQRNPTASNKPSSSQKPYIPYDTTKPGVFTVKPETKTYVYRLKDGLCTRCGMANHKADKCPHYPVTVTSKDNHEKSMKLHGHRFNSMSDDSGNKTGTSSSTPTSKQGNKPSRQQPSSSSDKRRSPSRKNEFNNVDSDDDNLSEAETVSNTTEDSAYSSRLNQLRKLLY